MKTLVAICVAFLSLTIAYTIATYIEWRDTKKLVTEGKTTVGSVTDANHYPSSRRSRDSYYLVVAFVDDDRRAQSKMIQVGRHLYDSTGVGSTVRVHYLPADPDVVQLGQRPRIRRRPFLASLFYLAFAIGVSGLCMFYCQRPPVQIHLRRPTPASDSVRNFTRS